MNALSYLRLSPDDDQVRFYESETIKLEDSSYVKLTLVDTPFASNFNKENVLLEDDARRSIIQEYQKETEKMYLAALFEQVFIYSLIL